MGEDSVKLYRFEIEMDDPRPVSINKLYSTNKSGKRFLTAEGKRFQDAFAAKVAGASVVLAKEIHDVVYKEGGFIKLHILLYLEKLHNAAWKYGGCLTEPRKRKDGTRPKAVPRSPYQRVDATNYTKLIEDAVVDGIGIDDSAHLKVSSEKREDPERPRVVVEYEVWL